MGQKSCLREDLMDKKVVRDVHHQSGSYIWCSATHPLSKMTREAADVLQSKSVCKTDEPDLKMMMIQKVKRPVKTCSCMLRMTMRKYVGK